MNLMKLMPVALALALAIPASGSATTGLGNWRALRPGRVVEIEGDWKERRGFVADEVDLRDTPGRGSVEIVAPLQDVTLDPPAIQLLGVWVDLAPDVLIRTETSALRALDSLRIGDRVEVDGDVDDESERIVADRIRLLDDTDNDVEIEGPVTGTPSARHVRVAGIDVALASDTQIRGGRLVERETDDDDGQPATVNLLNGRLRAGGRFEWAVEPEDNYDLDRARPGNLTESKWSGEVKGDLRLTSELDAFAKAGVGGKRIHLDEEQDEVNTVDWSLQQAWVAWQPRHRPGFALQIGRQDFDEPREWFWDENLDAARIHWWSGRMRTEAAVSTRWNVDSSRLRDQVNWMLHSRIGIANRWHAAAWVLHRRHESESGERPIWVGVRSIGRLSSRVRHWVDVARLAGRVGGTEVGAWGLDVGARVRLARAGRVNATVGWARGAAGASDAERFRQTGLHDNNAKFGGVTSFRYYGELLEPDLENLTIATAGLSFRPLRSSSVDLVYHRYEQVEARNRVHGANLDQRPTGLDTDLGSEWDLIIGFESIEWLNIEYVFAVFQPGTAFAADATSARFHKLELKLDF